MWPHLGVSPRRAGAKSGRRSHPLITWLFEAYATGDRSVESLLDELTARGFRSRGGPNTPNKPLSIAALHRMLRSAYYKGIVTHNGVDYQGKHDHLIDDETWERV